MSRESRKLVALLTLAVTINYIDRGNIATAAPLMQRDLGLSESQLGLLFSAFYWGYVPCMPATGSLAKRYGTRIVLASGLVVWSLSTAATAFASTFSALLILRVVLGIGESVTFPCASNLFASCLPRQKLGVANGIMSFGYLLGPGIGTLVGGYLMSVLGWQPVFVVLGIGSLGWLLLWRKVDSKGIEWRDGSSTSPPLKEILEKRALWGACLGHFSANYAYYFILSWLPFYLVKSRGFSYTSMASVAAWAYLVNAASAFGMGWLSDQCLRAGLSSTTVYKTIMGVAHVATLLCLVGMISFNQSGSVACLFAFEAISGSSYPALFAIPQILAGAPAAGRWVGIQNAAGNVAGLVAPALTGFLVERTGRFESAFLIAAGIGALGFLGWVVMIARVEPIQWRRHSE